LPLVHTFHCSHGAKIHFFIEIVRHFMKEKMHFLSVISILFLIFSLEPLRRISDGETTCCSSRNDVSLSNPKISSHNFMFHV
jgi:hypothetical protein